MNTFVARFKKVIAGVGLTAFMLSTLGGPVTADVWVPGPRLPPPKINPSETDTILPDGTRVTTAGNYIYTNGNVVYVAYSTGGYSYSAGTVWYPDDHIVWTDGTVRYADGHTVYPDGTVEYSDGRIVFPDGTTTFRQPSTG